MNQPPKQQQEKPKEQTAPKNQPNQPQKPVPPSKPKQQPLMRMQTGMDGMNFEEYCSSKQNFEEIQKELAQIVQS